MRRGTRWMRASTSRLLSLVDCSGKCFVRYSETIILGVDTRSSSWLPLSSRLLMLLDCARVTGTRPCRQQGEGVRVPACVLRISLQATAQCPRLGLFAGHPCTLSLCNKPCSTSLAQHLQHLVTAAMVTRRLHVLTKAGYPQLSGYFL